MKKRISGLGAAMAIAVLAPAVLAQQLDPRLAGPLQAMYQQAAAACQQGAPAGCQQMQNLQQVAGQLTQAQGACQAGNQQACAFYNNGAQQVMMAWQQSQMQQPMPGAMGGGQGFSPQQQQWEHQQRMQQQQMQFQQQQQQYQQQQRLNDAQHQRFMEQLRR